MREDEETKTKLTLVIVPNSWAHIANDSLAF